MSEKRRKISNRCLSCKKLKIKCDEARPSCEYCLHTGRTCQYSQKFPVPSSRGISEDDRRQLTIRLHSFNSVGTQMNMKRFELRLARYFQDYAVEMFIYGNAQAQKTWGTVVPRYFGSSDLIRQSVYAVSCLLLWSPTNLKNLLQSDHDLISSVADDGSNDDTNDKFTHLFSTPSVFDDSEDSIFSKTVSYFTSTLRLSRTHVDHFLTPDSIQYHEMVELFISGSLIHTYVCLHPHCIMPLVSFDKDTSLDAVGFFPSMRKVFLKARPSIQQKLIIEMDGQSFMSLKLRVGVLRFIKELRAQLADYLFATKTFLEINSKACSEHQSIKSVLDSLEICFLASIEVNHPYPLFRFLVISNDDTVAMARGKNYFMLRILFIYSCICIYCRLYISLESNLWIQFITYFRTNFSPLCELDNNLYNYVICDQHRVDIHSFRDSLKLFQEEAFWN